MNSILGIANSYFLIIVALGFLAFLQWGIVFFIISNSSTIFFNRIDGYAKVKKKISFTQDYFYLFWNIFPILLFLNFYYLYYSWDSWFLKILTIDHNDQILFLYKNTFCLTEKYWIIIISILGIIAFLSAVYVQNIKQKSLIKNKIKIYWWDRRISKKLYYTRIIFLFFNLILIMALLLIFFQLSYFIFKILSIPELNVFALHPDKYAGMQVLMQILSIIFSIYLLNATVAILAHFDHKKLGLTHKLSDMLNIFIILLGLVYLIFSISRFKYYLNYAYTEYITSNGFNSDDFIQLVENFDGNTKKISQYYSIIELNRFPLDLSFYSNSFIAFLIPISLWFIIKSFNMKSRIENKP